MRLTSRSPGPRRICTALSILPAIDRFHAVAQAGFDGSRALSPLGVIRHGRPATKGDQCGWTPGVWPPDRRIEGVGGFGRRCRCRPSPYLNNIIEQEHRFIKKRITASLGFRSAEGAWRTIEGYEAMHLIRKRQIRWSPKGDVIGQRHFIHTLFGIAA